MADPDVVHSGIQGGCAIVEGMVPKIPAEIEVSCRAFLALLEKWNRTHALTALPPAARKEELIQDAMALLPHMETLPARARVVDFGTGMGVPAVPLALARPDLRVLALDASSKKIAFVKQVILELGIANLEARAARAESLEPLNADLGMAKAVGSLTLLSGWWARHGRPGAPFLALKAGEGADAIALPGWHLSLHPYELPKRGSRCVIRLVQEPGP